MPLPIEPWDSRSAKPHPAAQYWAWHPSSRVLGKHSNHWLHPQLRATLEDISVFSEHGYIDHSEEWLPKATSPHPLALYLQGCRLLRVCKPLK